MKRAAIAALLAAVAVGDVARGAFIPHLDHPKIVPNQSIGGVKLDMSKHEVFELWGPGACHTSPAHLGAPAQTTCRGGPVSNTKGEQIFVTFTPAGGGVSIIIMVARTRASDGQIVRGELARRWRDRFGIHLGSPIADVGEAYPGAKPNRGEAVRGYDLFAGPARGGPGTSLRYTRFGAGIGPSSNRVASISYQWDICHFSWAKCHH